MQAMDNMLKRRSIRFFEPDKGVQQEELEQMVLAGMAAPNGFDERLWHFVIINDAAIMKKLGAAMEGCEASERAPAGILVCGDEALEKLPGIWVQDCSACVQNIQLAAHALGYGAVWLAMHLVDERVNAIRDVLGVPEHISPFALIPIGVPAEKGGTNERFDADRVHVNKW